MRINKQFQSVACKLRELGWVPYMPPLVPCVDDTWVFRRKSDKLDHLFVTESDLQWSRKRFTREPFGDYTNVYQPKGEGRGFLSLLGGAQ